MSVISPINEPTRKETLHSVLYNFTDNYRSHNFISIRNRRIILYTYISKWYDFLPSISCLLLFEIIQPDKLLHNLILICKIMGHSYTGIFLPYRSSTHLPYNDCNVDKSITSYLKNDQTQKTPSQVFEPIISLRTIH